MRSEWFNCSNPELTSLLAHHWVWKTSSILHRDISTNNIMWYRIGDKVIGVLCDWDLAEQNARGGNITSTRAYAGFVVPTTNNQNEEPVTNTGAETGGPENAAAKPRCRTGTSPFMAIDLLRSGPVPIHLYRHDLESFFYVLVYVCAVWDPILKKFGLSAWEHGSLSVIGATKIEFLKNDHTYNEIFANTHPSLKALTIHAPEPGWVSQLALMFGMAQMYADNVATLRLAALRPGRPSNVTCIRAQEELREQEVTYEKFMEILDAPTDVAGEVE